MRSNVAIGVILLAAGGSARMGRPKQLLPFRGTTLLRHAALLALATGLSPVVVVLGAAEAECRRELAGLNVVVAANANWGAGMGSSLQTGLELMEKISPQAEAALVMLHDQPLIEAEDLNALVKLWDAAHHPIAAALYHGTVGVPAVFDRRFFSEIRSLPAQEGAKKILLRHAVKTVTLELPAAAHDVDSAEDYAACEIVP